MSAAGLPSRLSAAVTSVGAVVGTLDYMAPEQARGEAVDQRADIYALGLMFSDMLLGKRQTVADTTGDPVSPLAALKKRLEKAPPPVRSADPTIPVAIDALISRCVQPDAAARFQTSAELVAELDRLDENGEPIPIKRVVGMKILAAVVTIALALLGGNWWYARTLIPPKAHDPVTVVIADIQNSTSDASFDRALEPTLRRALEDAGFVSAYDRSRVFSTFGVRPAATSWTRRRRATSP